MNNSQHVIPNGAKWGVKKTGSTRITKNFETKKQAEYFGKMLAKNQNAVLYIHGEDGRIEKKINSPNTQKIKIVYGKRVIK